MAVHPEVVLRQRVCRSQRCQTVFWICTHCDRGQRYCSADCRPEARRQQRRDANPGISGVPKAGSIIGTGNGHTGNVTQLSS
jgi:hypothetical protein